jgi:hypothetical protein
MNTLIYDLPTMTDIDTGDILSVLDVRDSTTNSCPPFIKSFTPTSITINATEYTQVKTYTMIVIITDS